MILYEYEGKKLLQNAGISIPNGQIISSLREAQGKLAIQSPLVLKAQVLSGKRADAGGIIKCDKGEEISDKLKELLGKEINKEKVEKVLVEEMVEYEGPEYYLSISYDTDTRGPILTISESGGTGIEEREVHVFLIDPITQSVIPAKAGIQKTSTWIPDQVRDDIIKIFFEQDCLLLEINPLVKSKAGEWVSLDAKVKLDDSALSRHEDWDFSPRSAPGHSPTKNEIEAKKIDEGDYRGVAGSTYFDLPGDIAILSSGGGVSLTAMDALIKEGGKPGNFTEYSGNPPKEKVVKLTKIVLNKPEIHGLWVIGTVAANFTDIYETLSGFIEGLRELKLEGIKLDFPIVIRRGGPRDQEAFEMLREVKDFNLILQSEETSIAQSAKVMAEEAKKYANR
jgi:succinyl-CoA synthetase beta subunit